MTTLTRHALTLLIVLGIVGVLLSIAYLGVNHPRALGALFFGLVGGSITGLLYLAVYRGLGG